MAFALNDNFDSYPTGDLDGQNGGSGWSAAWDNLAVTAISVVTDEADTGSNSAKFQNTVGNTYYKREFTSASDGDLYLALKCSDTSAANNVIALRSSDNNSQIFVRIKDGQVSTYNFTGSATINLASYTADTWVYVHIQVLSASTFRARAGTSTWGTWSATLNQRNSNTLDRFTIGGDGEVGVETWIDSISSTDPLASGTPTVTTQAATSITDTTATMNGNVTSDGGETVTERGFYWSTSPTVTTGDTKVTVAGTTGAYTSGLTSLTKGTTYYYRAFATNSEGTTLDDTDTSFTTDEEPDAFVAGDWTVTNLATGGDIRIAISSLPSDNGSAITDLEYKIDAGSWTSLSGTTTGNYDISGLTDDVEVDVVIRAVNSVGNGADSDTKAVTPTAAPTAPAQFGTGDWSVADRATDGAIRITITTLPDDGGSSITDLEYQLDAGSWVSMSTTTTGTFDITGLTNGTEYDVAVRAVNAVGNGTASATKTVTPTLAPAYVGADTDVIYVLDKSNTTNSTEGEFVAVALSDLKTYFNL